LQMRVGLPIIITLMPYPAPSRILLVTFGLVVLSLISSWEHVWGDMPFGSFTEPVSIAIHGLRDTDRQWIQVTYLPPIAHEDPDDRPRDFESITIPQNGFCWSIPFRAVVQLHITAPAEVLHRIESVSLDIGEKRQFFDMAQLAAAWRPIDPFYAALDQPAESVTTLAWPPQPAPGEMINLRSHQEILTAVGKRAMAILMIAWCCCVLLIAVMRRRRHAPSPGKLIPHNERTMLWLLIGFAVFCAGVAIARSREPYAFTQDDNLSQFLPVIIRSAQDLFQGRFPVWNPHQLMGAPTATVGTYMLTYPPTYLSYWIAKQVFGDPYLTVELFFTFHLTAGYFVTFWVLRRFGLRPSLAVAGALSFTLCAFLLIGGRSQATFIPIAVWLPLLAASILALERGPVGWKWALATGALIGIYFHAGHAQYWVYALMFFATAVGLLSFGRRIPWARSLWCIPAFSFGLALAAPLLFGQLLESKGRHFGSGGTGVSLLGMLVPLGRGAPDMRQPLSWPEWSGQTPCFGTTFAVAGLIGLAYYFYLLLFCKLTWHDVRLRTRDAAWLLVIPTFAFGAIGRE